MRKFYRVCRRDPPPRGGRQLGFQPVQSANIQPLFAAILEGGYVTYGELRMRDDNARPLVDLADALTLSELLLCRIENQRRADASAERKYKKPRK